MLALAVLRSKGAAVYAASCLALILVTGIPLQAAGPIVTAHSDEAMILWLGFGFLLPVFETWIVQDCLQEALLRRGAAVWVRITASCAVSVLLHRSSLVALLVFGLGHGFLYALTYAVWRSEGRNRAFAMTFFLNLMASNALLGASLLFASTRA
ncbi:MAG TPA: hypothetical protein VM687_12365 [Stenotrophomonas sp.]|nr:hypothetical protein [Stenotrophomonas sp.]